MNSDRALNIVNQEIKKMEQIKLLGIYINENLNFAGHISNLCTRACRNVGLLVHVCNLLPCNAKLTLYKSAILPHLTYWHLVCNFCKSSKSRKIVQVQEGALQAIYKSLATNYVNREQNHFISFHSIYHYAVNKYFKHLLINFCSLFINY